MPRAMAATDTQADTTEQLCELCSIDTVVTHIQKQKKNKHVVHKHMGNFLFRGYLSVFTRPLNLILKKLLPL